MKRNENQYNTEPNNHTKNIYGYQKKGLTLAPSFPGVPSDPFSPILPCDRRKGRLYNFLYTRREGKADYVMFSITGEKGR